MEAGAMTVRPRKKVWKKKRPAAVTVVAWGIAVLFVVRLYQVIEPLMRMRVLDQGLNAPLISGYRLTLLGGALLTSAWYLAQVLAGIVVLIGFLRVQRWAWVMLMVWTGFSLCIALINYFYSRPNYVVMASDVIIAVALSQSEVQRIFGIRMDPDEPAD
jgi:hypothetical protein